MSTPIPLPPDSFTCARHGWLSHAAVHEAAHAVFAVDHDFPFVSVSILSPEQLRAAFGSNDKAVAGGVLLAAPARELFQGRADDALDFCLAGGRAETGTFGHQAPGSLQGDLRLWVIGTGRSEVPDAVDAAEMRDASFGRLDAWLTHRSGSVLDLARALTSGVEIDAAGRYDDFEPITMTAAEVRAVLGA
jgi:hypothetical protein